jgi:hypothetical protein
MTTAPRHPFLVASSVHSQDIDRSEFMGKSPGKFSAKQSATSYRAHFAERWGEFIRDNFDSPEHAAMVFGVDGSTARKWWAGSHAPSGFAVGMAFQAMPDAAARRLRSAT